MNKDKPKVPISVAWLSENGMLEKAATLLGYSVSPNSRFNWLAMPMDVVAYHAAEEKK